MTMAMTEPIEDILVIGQCDRCGRDVLGKKNEVYSMLELRNYKYDTESYQLQMLICSDCRYDFKKWMNEKIPMKKGDDTT